MRRLTRYLLVLVLLVGLVMVDAAIDTLVGAQQEAQAQTTKPQKVWRIDDGTDDTQTRTFYGYGYQNLVIQCSAPGTGTDYTWALTSRTCVTAAACTDWEAVDLSSGTLSDTDTLELVVEAPQRYEYQLTLTVTVGTPVIYCIGMLN